MTVFALANQKGGVGKTTTVINLGFALSQKKAKVLLIDFDPQFNLTTFVGISQEKLSLTIYEVLFQKGVKIEDAIIKNVKKNVDLIPASMDLAAAERLLLHEIAGEHVLREKIESVRDKYDFILIDCPPHLGQLTLNAMTAADELIIPVECAFPAIQGLSQLIEIWEGVTKRLNPKLKIRGMLLTMYDKRTKHAQEVISKLRKQFGKIVFQSVIPHTVRFNEAPIEGLSILEYDPESKAAEAFKAFGEEILNG